MPPEPFTDFAIPYSPIWAGGIVFVVGALLIGAGFLCRSRNVALYRLLLASGIVLPMLFLEWELLVRFLGLDSVLGFFLLAGSAVALGVGAGLWTRSAEPDRSSTE